jgi:hypothetical protein
VIRPRFKLRTLLVATTLFAAALAGWRLYTQPFRQAKLAVAELSAFGARVETEPVVFSKWLRWLPWTRDCIKITKVANYHMSEHYPGFSEYDLRNRNLDDRTLKACARVNTISTIWLPDTKITDAGLAQLSRMTALEHLDVRETVISDAGLEHLSHLPSLKSLCLVKTRVTDEGVQYIAKFNKLRSLNVSSSCITEAGFQKLLTELPQCSIHCHPHGSRQTARNE